MLTNLVKQSDKFYWHMTKERIASEIGKYNNKIKKITALAVTSTVITASVALLGILLIVISNLQQSTNNVKSTE